jgi:hypothetical protein
MEECARTSDGSGRLQRLVSELAQRVVDAPRRRAALGRA